MVPAPLFLVKKKRDSWSHFYLDLSIKSDILILVMKLHLDLYTHKVTVIKDSEFKNWIEGSEKVVSPKSTVYVTEEYLVIVIK